MTAAEVVLCDLDGTLTDRDAGFRAWSGVFAQQWDLSSPQRERLDDLDLAHRQRDAFFAAVVAELHLPATAEQLWADYRRQMPDLTPAFPGVHHELQELRAAGWLLAVVSNGKDDNQRGKLRSAHLVDLFDAVVVSESAGVRKPDPAIFARALSELGVDQRATAACWVVGDDPVADIAGGRRFGASTCWVSDGKSWPAGEPAPTTTSVTAAEGLRLIRG